MFANGNVYDGFCRKGKFNGPGNRLLIIRNFIFLSLKGMYYQKAKNKWVYGIYEDNMCIELINTGTGFPHGVICKC